MSKPASGPSLVRQSGGYCRAMCARSSASGSAWSSPLTSTVTSWIVPVNVNGLVYSGVTGEPGLAPQVRIPGFSANGTVTGASASATSAPSR